MKTFHIVIHLLSRLTQMEESQETKKQSNQELSGEDRAKT